MWNYRVLFVAIAISTVCVTDIFAYVEVFALVFLFAVALSSTSAILLACSILRSLPTYRQQ